MIGKSIFFLIRNKLLIGSLLFFATITILIFTMLPSNKLGSSSLYEYDKIGHFVLFFGWTFIFGLFNFSRKYFKARLFGIFLAGALFGIAVELLQGFLPYGRSADLYDAFADILGSFSATLLLYVVKRRYSKQYQNHLKSG